VNVLPVSALVSLKEYEATLIGTPINGMYWVILKEMGNRPYRMLALFCLCAGLRPIGT